jgi:hypothetical protein
MTRPKIIRLRIRGMPNKIIKWGEMSNEFLNEFDACACISERGDLTDLKLQ